MLVSHLLTSRVIVVANPSARPARAASMDGVISTMAAIIPVSAPVLNWNLTVSHRFTLNR